MTKGKNEKDETIVKLIEKVQGAACLYAKADPKYYDNIYKSVVWQKIAEEMGYEGELWCICSCLLFICLGGPAASKKWKQLRNSYSTEKKKPVSGSGAIESKWPYLVEMSFLKPEMEERPRLIFIEYVGGSYVLSLVILLLLMRASLPLLSLSPVRSY
jgi:hypothetical protein